MLTLKFESVDAWPLVGDTETWWICLSTLARQWRKRALGTAHWCEWHGGRAQPNPHGWESVAHVLRLSSASCHWQRFLLVTSATGSFSAGSVSIGVAHWKQAAVIQLCHLHPSIPHSLPPSLAASPPLLRYACVNAPNANELPSL